MCWTKNDHEYDRSSDKLRDTMKFWLKTTKRPTWQSIVGALGSRVVGEPKLASDIEAKYCHTAEAKPTSNQGIPGGELGQSEQELQTAWLQQVLPKLQQLPLSQQLSLAQQLVQQLRLLEQQLPTTQKSIPVLTWQSLSKAPEEMSRGTAVSDGKMAYFNGGGSTAVYAYDSENQQWSRLPDCLPD